MKIGCPAGGKTRGRESPREMRDEGKTDINVKHSRQGETLAQFRDGSGSSERGRYL